MSGGEEEGYDMWDEEDNFFYDILCLPDGQKTLLKVRSLVGLLPLCAATVFPPDIEGRFPELLSRVRAFLGERPDLAMNMTRKNEAGTFLLSIMDETKLRHVLARMLDENEFLSPYGIRSISRYQRMCGPCLRFRTSTRSICRLRWISLRKHKTLGGSKG